MYRPLSILASAVISIAAYADSGLANQGLWNEFVNPPSDCRTKLWWFHGETETTREGIDADLQAFKDKGVGGVVFYDQIHGKGDGAAPAMSAEWWDMLKYASQKARELGLSFEVAASNGYVAGGPWITPELAMKKVVYVDTVMTVKKPCRTSIDLNYPSQHFTDIATLVFSDDARLAPYRPYVGEITVSPSCDTIIYLNTGGKETFRGISYTLSARGKGSTGSMNIPGKPQERYFGAGYVDYPPIGQLEYSRDGKNWYAATQLLTVENNIGHKSRQRTISFPAVTAKHFRLKLHNPIIEGERNTPVKISDIRLYRRDIVDNTEAQTGLRTEVTYPAAVGGNAGAVDSKSVINVTDSVNKDGILTLNLGKGTWHILRFGYIPTGARTKHGRKNLLGYEADVMSEEAAATHYNNYFKQILDTLASAGAKPSGMCMDSHEAGTQNWTQDLDKSFAKRHGYDLLTFLPAFAGYIVDNRETTDNALRDFRRHVAETIAEKFYGTFARLCGADSVDFTSQCMLNILTDNVEGRAKASKPQGEFWAYQTNGNYDCLDAASAAHLYGRIIASGEAFTDTPYDTPFDSLLRIANIAYCRGINEFAICASSYQPWLDHKYDDSASQHPYVFHRFHPEWPISSKFWDYQARCAYMLRKGSPVVDLCIYIGEEPPLKTMAYKLPDTPESYNFDVCTYPSLMHRMTVADGELAVEGGMRYKALVIPSRTYISPEAEKKIDELANSGLTVIRCDKGHDVASSLAKAGIAPGIYLESANLPDDRLLHFHRRMDDGRHIYFLYNHSPRPYNNLIKLREKASDARLWDPTDVTDKAASVQDGSLMLSLAPFGSTFIITLP